MLNCLPGTQGPDSNHYYYGNYRYHAKYPWPEREMLDCIEYMKNVAIEERPSVCATMAREFGFTGLSVLHRLYAAYGFNVLKDLVFDGMHDVSLNVIKHHLEVQLELGLLNKATIEERLEAMPWTSGNFQNYSFKTIYVVFVFNQNSEMVGYQQQ